MNSRPTVAQEDDRHNDSDEDDFRDRDYDISTMASNINREVYRYGMFETDDAEEVSLHSIPDLASLWSEILSVRWCKYSTKFHFFYCKFRSSYFSILACSVQGHGAMERDEEVHSFSLLLLSPCCAF